MRKLVFSFLVLFATACTNDDEMEAGFVSCIEFKENDSFETLLFKENYTIQFPVGYTGIGLEITEFVNFEFSTPLGSKFHYAFSCDTDCASFFGETLESPTPDQVIGTPPFPTLVLDAQREFCLSENVEAVFYYNSTSSALTHGKLYMKVDSEFKEGLFVDFDINNLDEVESVLRTIVRE